MLAFTLLGLLACRPSSPDPVTPIRVIPVETVDSTDTDGHTDPDTDTDVDPDTGLYSGTWTPPDRRELEHPDLPPAPDGVGYTVLSTKTYTVSFDPADRDPLSAAGECAAVVMSCFEPGVRDVEGCLRHAPTCPTTTPWVGDGPMCCPSACLGRYLDLRRGGLGEAQAIAQAVFHAPSCMPGLDAQLGEDK